MPPAKPSMDLVRSATDEHVLRAFLAQSRLTRAELAVRTGLSKPTASESVRRLTEAGLLRDTGERTTGRGRVGTYYALSDALGAAVVAGIAPPWSGPRQPPTSRPAWRWSAQRTRWTAGPAGWSTYPTRRSWWVRCSRSR